MTVRELVNRIYEKVDSGGLRMSDDVPEDLFDQDGIDVAEYVRKKYGIGEESVR